MPNKSDFIEAMVKHLAPSASELRLLDIGGVAGEILLQNRPDLKIDIASLNVNHWQYKADSVDSVVAYDSLLKADLLSGVMTIMRPGGRFILVNPLGIVEEDAVKALEDAGYIRILVESAVNGSGVLIRGEKAHDTGNTFKRVKDVAKRDADLLELDSYTGRFVHLLIIQTPNKPVWKFEPDEHIKWQAVAIEKEGNIALLAFSSLPKAVSFMQSAVVKGFVKDVNKVGKFSKSSASTWNGVTLLNPTLYNIQNYAVRLVPINPDTAEIPDE